MATSPEHPTLKKARAAAPTEVEALKGAIDFFMRDFPNYDIGDATYKGHLENMLRTTQALIDKCNDAAPDLANPTAIDDIRHALRAEVEAEMKADGIKGGVKMVMTDSAGKTVATGDLQADGTLGSASKGRKPN